MKKLAFLLLILSNILLINEAHAQWRLMGNTDQLLEYPNSDCNLQLVFRTRPGNNQFYDYYFEEMTHLEFGNIGGGPALKTIQFYAASRDLTNFHNFGALQRDQDYFDYQNLQNLPDPVYGPPTKESIYLYVSPASNNRASFTLSFHYEYPSQFGKFDIWAHLVPGKFQLQKKCPTTLKTNLVLEK